MAKAEELTAIANTAGRNLFMASVYPTGYRPNWSLSSIAGRRTVAVVIIPGAPLCGADEVLEQRSRMKSASGYKETPAKSVAQGEAMSFYFIAGIAALGGLLFGCDTGVISGAPLFIRETVALSPTMQGVAAAIVLAGAAVGAAVAGKPTRRGCIPC